MPVIIAERFKQAGPGHTGIVDHHIQPAPAPRHPLDGVAQILFVAHVTAREHAVHTLFGQCLTSLFTTGVMDISNGDPVAAAAGFTGQCQAQAAGPAGDQYCACLSQLRSPGLVDKGRKCAAMAPGRPSSPGSK